MFIDLYAPVCFTWSTLVHLLQEFDRSGAYKRLMAWDLGGYCKNDLHIFNVSVSLVFSLLDLTHRFVLIGNPCV